MLALAGIVAGTPQLPATGSADRTSVIVVVGAAGEPKFAAGFSEQVEAWKKIAATAAANLQLIGTDKTEITSHAQLQAALRAEVKEGASELWLVLIGHGTFDGREAKFNLQGPDVTATEMAEWLKPFRRPLAVIDTSSASAPFLGKLAARGRVVVTSTRSGYEQNYSRFGKYLAEAIGQPRSDLDKDGQVSLLEAFLSAAQRTAEFYKTEGRLATEHALIDDNGDGLGTPAEWFRGVRATKQAKEGAALDGARAQQFTLVRSAAELRLSAEVRALRDKLELRLAELRESKAKLPEGAYYKQLEGLLLELAELYPE